MWAPGVKCEGEDTSKASFSLVRMGCSGLGPKLQGQSDWAAVVVDGDDEGGDDVMVKVGDGDSGGGESTGTSASALT